MGKFLFIALVLIVGQTVHAGDNKNCAEEVRIELLDHSGTEPITIVFNKDEDCSLPWYGYSTKGGFWGYRDDAFDDLSLELYITELGRYSSVEFDLDALDPSGVYGWIHGERVKIAECVVQGGRKYLKFLRPYKIVASENRIYID